VLAATRKGVSKQVTGSGAGHCYNTDLPRAVFAYIRRCGTQSTPAHNTVSFRCYS